MVHPSRKFGLVFSQLLNFSNHTSFPPNHWSFYCNWTNAHFITFWSFILI